MGAAPPASLISTIRTEAGHNGLLRGGIQLPFTGKESQKLSEEGVCVVCHLSEAAAADEKNTHPCCSSSSTGPRPPPPRWRPSFPLSLVRRVASGGGAGSGGVGSGISRGWRDDGGAAISRASRDDGGGV